MKLIYNYDKETGEYFSRTQARLDPAETELQKKDIFLLPANATFIEPPDAAKNKIPVFNGKWKMRSDFRGIKYYDAGTGTESEITKIGKRIPEGSISEAPSIDLIKPCWDGKKWAENAPLFLGKMADTRKNLKKIVRNAIVDLGEEKAKTLFLISFADGVDCPEWDIFINERRNILIEADNFILEHNLV